MREAESLSTASWALDARPEIASPLLHAWHPRTLLTWADALSSTAYILPRLGRAEEPSRVLNRWSRNLLRALRVKVEFAAPIPEGAQLWVSNHLSWLDAPVLLAQRPMGTLAKAEVARYPLLGLHARRAGLRFVNREDPASRAVALLEVTRHWREGAPFLLFPEGTTTRGGRLAPIYEGGLRAAFRLGLSVLPMRLESPDAHYPWTGDESLPPHIQMLCRSKETKVRLHPGPLMQPCGDEEAWLQEVRTHLAPPMN